MSKGGQVPALKELYSACGCVGGREAEYTWSTKISHLVQLFDIYTTETFKGLYPFLKHTMQ